MGAVPPGQRRDQHLLDHPVVLALVEPARTLELAMPDGYRRSIRAAMELRGRLMDAALSAT